MAPTATGVGSRALLTAASTIVVIAGLKAAQSLVIPFLIATFLAILCSPVVIWLQRRRVPTVVAILLVVVVVIGVLSAFGAVLGGSVKEFTNSIPEYQERVNAMARSSLAWARGFPRLAPHLDAEQIMKNLQDVFDLGALMGFVGTSLKGLLAALSNTLLVILILVFMLVEAAGFPAKIRAASRGSIDPERFAKVVSEVQQYLAIKTLLSLATGTILGVWMSILGLDFAIVFGLLAFLLNYIPTIGSIIAAVPAITLALIQLGPGRAALILLGFVIVNVAIGNLTEPHLMGRRLGMSTLVVFLSLIFWGWVWGPVGMLLSVPLTMIVKILLENSEDLKWLAVMLDSGRAAAARVARQEEATAATE